MEFAENHPIIPWTISYASSLINKFRIDTDGKTAHERCRGRKFNRIVPQFGERIMYRKFQNKRKDANWKHNGKAAYIVELTNLVRSLSSVLLWALSRLNTSDRRVAMRKDGLLRR